MNDQLPRMMRIRPNYPASKKPDISTLIRQQFVSSGVTQMITPGMKIALGIGSRGISNIREIVEATIDVLLDCGAHPFLVPAMGSHGGATAEGQAMVLDEYGITQETMNVPIETSMEVRKIGCVLEGLDVVFSAPALEADGVIAINRVKPHTDFRGRLGSGIQKMLTIGFGKQIGAANAHRAAAHVGHEKVLREFSRVIMERVHVICGVAILEDQHHETVEIEVLRSAEIPEAEDRLLERSRNLMPRLPLDEIDLLIVDQIGKEISGTGMDTNIIGRDVTGYTTSLYGQNVASPRIHRIFVRDLSAATHGNGVGIGLADFTTTRAVKALDLRASYVNSLTAGVIHSAKIPLYFDSDREAIDAALGSLATPETESLRVVRILNTLMMDHLLVSEACLSLIERDKGIVVEGESFPMTFDENGNLDLSV